MTTINSEAVEQAYREGWRDSENSSNGGFGPIQEDDGWKRSEALAALTAPTPDLPYEPDCSVCGHVGAAHEAICGTPTPADDVVERWKAKLLIVATERDRLAEDRERLFEESASQQARIAALWGLADEALDMVHELSETQNYSVSRYVELRALLNQEPGK